MKLEVQAWWPVGLVFGAVLAGWLVRVLVERLCRLDFRPRDLKVQDGIERAVAMLGQPHLDALGRWQVYGSLERARRRTRNAAHRRTLDEACSVFCSAHEAAGALRDELRAKLLAMLAELADTPRRPRDVPSTWWQFLVFRSGLVDGLLTLFASTLLWQASYHWFPVAGSGIGEKSARYLAWLILVWKLIGAGTMLVSSVLLYRSHAEFRSLFITARPISDPNVRAVIEGLARHGKLVALLLDQDPPSGWPDFTLKSLAGDIRFEPSSWTEPILAALIHHTDFVVVDLDDSSAQRLLPVLQRLPLSRRARLIESAEAAETVGFTPVRKSNFAEGAFRGHFERADAASTAPDYGHTAHGYAAGKMADSLSAISLVIGASLCLIAGWRVIGAYLLACGAAGIFPRLLGPARRRSVSPRTLRGLQSLSISRFLTTYRSWTNVLYALAGLGGIGCAWSVFGIPDTLTEHLRFQVVAVPLAWLSMLLLLPGLIRAVKWALDWNFRIVLLHRNIHAVSGLHKAVVMPLCGAYGQVVVISDEALARLEIRDGTKFAHEVLSEHFNTIGLGDHLEPWQQRVERELQTADFAVFDWRTDISDAMVWELEQGLAALPARRVLIIVDEQTQQRAQELLNAAGPASDGIALLRLPPDYARAHAVFGSTLQQLLADLPEEARALSRWTHANPAPAESPPP